MEDYIKAIIITFLTFIFGLIIINALDAYQLVTLWLIICVLFEIILMKLFAVHALSESGGKDEAK